MSEAPELKTKAVVVSSQCPHYKPGDEILFDGPCVAEDNKAALCIVAINAIYPFIYSARRGGWIKDGPIQCPDCGESVQFRIELA